MNVVALEQIKQCQMRCLQKKKKKKCSDWLCVFASLVFNFQVGEDSFVVVCKLRLLHHCETLFSYLQTPCRKNATRNEKINEIVSTLSFFISEQI